MRLCFIPTIGEMQEMYTQTTEQKSLKIYWIQILAIITVIIGLQCLDEVDPLELTIEC